MVTQDEVPDSWDDDCPSKGTKVEIGQYDGSFDTINNWLEVPTSFVKVWENKSDSPHIKKTCKFHFPTEWDGRDVREIVSGYGSNSIIPARVSLKDEDGNWILTHCGYIGAVGGRENPLESKAWIYDFSERFEGMYVSKSYNFPTARQVYRDMVSEMSDSLVPINSIVFLAPQSETAYLRTTDLLASGDAPTPSDISYYGYDTEDLIESEDGELAVFETEIDTGPSVPFGSEAATLFEITLNPTAAGREFIDTLSDNLAGGTDEFTLDDTPTPITDEVVNATDWLYKNTPLGNKNFEANHDTVGDVLQWITERTGTQWHFEPTQNGVTLLIEPVIRRRTFVQDSVVSLLQSGDVSFEEFANRYASDKYQAHETVTVRDNNALFQTAPANTVVVRGDTRKSLLEGNTNLDGFVESIPLAFEDTDYPIVTATATSLFQAANEQELTVERDSEASSTGEVKEVALKTLQEQFDQTSEGSITMDGAPRLLPFDVIDALETCDRYVTEQIPIRYEIESITHTDGMTSTLETDVNVQPHLDETTIEFESTMGEIDG